MDSEQIARQQEQLDRIEAMLAEIKLKLEAYEAMFGALAGGGNGKVLTMVMKAMGDRGTGGVT